jgi:Flp pilus assembly protein TadG
VSVPLSSCPPISVPAYAAARAARSSRGAETVELAVTLPLVLLVIFSGFEYGWAVLKSLQLDHAARQGAREAAMWGATAGSIEAAVDDALARVGIDASAATITITPSNPADVAAGTPITVQVTARYSDLRLLGLDRLIPMPDDLTGRAGMVKEPES